MKLLAMLAMLAAMAAEASELTAYREERAVGMTVTNVAYPATLPRNLTSGLTNRILIRVSLFAAERPIRQRAIELAFQYDLWDENFRMTLSIDDTLAASSIFADAQAVAAYLSSIKLPNVFSPTDLTGPEPFSVRAELLLNPIEKERMEEIRKWVARNSTYAPSDPTGAGSGRPVGASLSQAVFNRIFDQYANGANVAAIWTETVTSKPFRLQDLPDAQP